MLYVLSTLCLPIYRQNIGIEEDNLSQIVFIVFTVRLVTIFLIWNTISIR